MRKLIDGFIRFGDVLGSIMTFLILTLMYYSVVLFVRVFGWIFRKKFVDVRFDKTASTYWIDVEKDFNRPTLERMRLPF